MNNKLGTLKSMTEESFLNRPEQAPEAIEEYLRNIDSDKVESLKKHLEDKEYLEQFKVAITHTSLMVFIAAFSVTDKSSEVDFEQYTREFLFYARSDDKDIYDMRVFYLSNLNAEEMGIGEIDSSEEIEPALQAEITHAKNSYNNLIKGLIKQYTDSKIHLM